MTPNAGERSYVYYRVAAADVAACVSQARTFFDRCEELHEGLRIELLRRPDVDANGLVTLMEVHAGAADRRAAIEVEAHAALALWIVGERHVETFVEA